MKKKFPLHLQILTGLILGLFYGAGVSFFIDSPEFIQKFTADWISPFGKIFVNCLKLIAVPLVLFSLVNGIASLKDISRLGKIGGKAISMYLITTVIAVSCGLLMVNAWKPWMAIEQETAQEIIKTFSNQAGGKISTAIDVLSLIHI